MEQAYRYVIVGGALTAASAIKGIREHDRDGSILLIGNEPYLPYHRPPLTKELWFGKKTVEQIFINPAAYYLEQHVTVRDGVQVVRLDAAANTITDVQGQTFRFEKLLLATGGIPHHLPIPGGDLDGITYYRYLADYQIIRAKATPGMSAVVIGGGFIGSEISAALCVNHVKVTMIYPDHALVARIFPDDMGRAMQQRYRERGITILDGDMPTAITREGDQFVTHTKSGQQLASTILIAGIGITAAVELAQQAGLHVDNGIVVNEFLQSSNPNIYAAGDNANFPYVALDERRRVEHWDNALNQGACAGRNMAGAQVPYEYMPYFYSDLFEFGYEAVGDVTTRLEVFADWTKEFDTGVLYYLRDGKVRGAMMCNSYGKVEAARALIQRGEPMTPERLRGAIPSG